MQAQLELYKQWAPEGAMWTQWVKPVVFMNIRSTRLYEPSGLPNVTCNWIGYEPETMLIIDLKGEAGLAEGLALARIGYRPIPLYNGVPAPDKVPASVLMDGIVKGLCGGGTLLNEMNLSDKANPAFILDAARMSGSKKRPGIFDNRWSVVTQDMPSANYLKKHNVRRIVVRTDKLRDDLTHILYGYQQKGIPIYLCSIGGKLALRTIAKPRNFKGFFFRFLVFLGLVRCATGGFGTMIPMASQGSGYRSG